LGVILGSFWWTLGIGVLSCAVGLAVVVASGVVACLVAGDLYTWLRPRLLAWHRRQRLLRESRQLRRVALTSEDFGDWCEVRDDEADA
jgi:hypothetical protein